MWGCVPQAKLTMGLLSLLSKLSKFLDNFQDDIRYHGPKSWSTVFLLILRKVWWVTTYFPVGPYRSRDFVTSKVTMWLMLPYSWRRQCGPALTNPSDPNAASERAWSWRLASSGAFSDVVFFCVGACRDAKNLKLFRHLPPLPKHMDGPTERLGQIWSKEDPLLNHDINLSHDAASFKPTTNEK